MDGLSTQDELFAIRLLELARHAAPSGDRVKFVNFCETGRIRSFLEKFPQVWQQITDKPVREGITTEQEYTSKRVAYSLQAAAFHELAKSRLDMIDVRHLWLGGLSLARVLYGDISARDFVGLRLLVSPQDVPSAQRVLQELGFEPTGLSTLALGQRQALLRWGYQQTMVHDQTRLNLCLSWRLFSPWIGAGLRGFDDLWTRARRLDWEGLSDWATLGAEDTIVYLALRGFETGWRGLQHLLELAVALDVLDYTWDQARELAGPRAVLLEQAVELTVRLLGVPHPQSMTFHYADYGHALATWTRWHRSPEPPLRDLLNSGYWSCDASQALRRRIGAFLTPELEDIQAVALAPTFLFLYPVIRVVRLFLGGKAAEALDP